VTTESRAIPAVLLAGGLARRMGGGDKPMRTILGRSILERVIARLAPQCDGLILNANGDPARFAAFGLPVIADGVADFPGPLAGILAGLDWAAAHRPEVSHILSAAADCPFLPRDLVARLEAARREQNAELAASGAWPCANNFGTRWSRRISARSTAGPRAIRSPPSAGRPRRSIPFSTPTRSRTSLKPSGWRP
jgi:molybdopterin-guanine dinucleotide biosynthesis protein A